METVTAINFSTPAPHPAQSAGNSALAMTIAKDKTLTILMQRAQGGHEESYSRLLREILPLISKLTRRQMPSASASDHDDILQEVLLSIHAARASYDPNRPFIPWLKSIVANRTIDFIRRQNRHSSKYVVPQELANDIVDEAAGDAIGRHEAVDALRKAIKTLPDGQRSAIELLKLREMSLREAAAITGMSVSALKASIHRAVRTLRGTLAPYQAAQH
jgi:RNA polymerase sigma factor (sigma-70 family)